MKFNLKQIEWINVNYNIFELLDELGVHVPNNKMIFCPFHDNKRTPAAKAYSDTNRIWCFSEQRRYGAFNLMKVLHYSDEKIQSFLPEDLSNFDIENYVLKIPKLSKAVLEEKDLFKKLSYMEHIYKNKTHVECFEFGSPYIDLKT